MIREANDETVIDNGDETLHASDVGSSPRRAVEPFSATFVGSMKDNKNHFKQAADKGRPICVPRKPHELQQ